MEFTSKTKFYIYSCKTSRARPFNSTFPTNANKTKATSQRTTSPESCGKSSKPLDTCQSVEFFIGIWNLRIFLSRLKNKSKLSISTLPLWLMIVSICLWDAALLAMWRLRYLKSRISNLTIVDYIPSAICSVSVLSSTNSFLGRICSKARIPRSLRRTTNAPLTLPTKCARKLVQLNSNF